MPKPKTGGRTKGTPNKRTTDERETVRGLFERLGGPGGEMYAQQLHNLAALPHDDAHVRMKALSVIAPYVWGKPAETVAVTASVTAAVTVIHEYYATPPPA